MSSKIYLTKSRYTAGLQCERRLWLNVHERTDCAEPESGSPQDVGLEIGRMAHLLFPGGVLVDQKPWEHAAAVARTAALMADGSVPAIFEAAFEHSGVRVRVDILERLPLGGWGLREVKSSGGVKNNYCDDVAVQVHVIGGAGVDLSSVEILHVNKGYVRGPNGIDWPRFFDRVEVKTETTKRLDGIEARLLSQFTCLSLPEAPNVEPDKHCHSPYSCEYWESCTAAKPQDWVYYLPKLKARRRAELNVLGVESISKIPDEFSLSPRQEVIRYVTRTGKPFVSPDLAKQLEGFGPPAFYLDFETFAPAVPLYPGTRPYQTLPFQWSLHSAVADGTINHQEFLADDNSDPRRQFTETLMAALEGTNWPIIVYSSYEQTQLRELARTFPDLADPIGNIVRRLADLLPIVRGGAYHPGFGFSNSIKSVAPALCPDVTYEDLDVVADGMGASTAHWLMASRRTDLTTSTVLRRALLAYCKRDTWAVVRLHQALRGLASTSK